MADVTAFIGEVREQLGRGSSRALRRAGRVPAIIYGDDNENVSVSVGMRELQKDLQRAGFTNRLCEVAIGDSNVRVLPREVQVDPVTDVPLHVDFMRISPRARVRLSIPVVFVDDEESPGIKRGGILNVVRHDIEFYCRADAIPENIVISLAGLDIGDGVHISSVTLPEGTRPTITDRDFTIATIASPSIHVEEEVKTEGIEGEAGELGEGVGDEGAESEGTEASADSDSQGDQRG
jgi:large subunit ribosomal protein L25